MKQQKPRLLCLDDNHEIGDLLIEIASSTGFDAYAETSPSGLFDKLDALLPEVIILDLQLPGMDGIEILRRLAERGIRSGILLISGTDARAIASASYYGAELGLRLIGTLEKPFDPSAVASLLRVEHARVGPLTRDDFILALDEGQLFVEYQPTASLREDAWCIDSLEALLRWEHPARGTLMPASFMSLCDDATVGRLLTDFVIEQGLSELKGWSARGYSYDLRINLSATLVSDLEFPDRLEAVLANLDISPTHLILELNDTASLAGREECIDILTRLRLKGFRIAIDDFGIGYSSLVNLLRLPFTEIKIDGQLTKAATDSVAGKTMVEVLADLAHRLGLTVCAEGIETIDAIRVMEKCGCDSIQGFVIGRAAAGVDLLAIVENWFDSQGAQVHGSHDKAARNGGVQGANVAAVGK